MPTAKAPESLAVVVVPLIGGAALRACLARLAPAAGPVLVVVGRGGEADGLARIIGDYGARLVATDAASVPARRRRGVEVASTEIVALLEDTTLPDAGWCDAVRAAFVDPRVAGAGGPVRVSISLPGRLQALGWSDYGAFHPALCPLLAEAPVRPDGTVPVARLPGNNLAFRRAAVLDVLDGDLIEGAAGHALRARGLDIVLHPGMAATYAGADRRGGGLGARFHHGRIFGAARAADRSWAARFGLAATAPALPLVLSWRTLGRMRRSVPLAALPRLAFWVGLLETAWAIGEGVGSLAGQGDSLARWR